MREALTILGFLLILAFGALFAAPLYIDWNNWRDTIAERLSAHLGAAVRIDGRIEARLLPQPYLSIHTVTVGNPQGRTRLSIAGIDGDLSLPALLRGDVELSDVVLSGPRLTIETDGKGAIEPLNVRAAQTDAAVDSFEIQDGSLHYIDAAAGQDVTVGGFHLVGEARSLEGPLKAEGGLTLGGVAHTVKIATGRADAGGMTMKLTLVPADKPLTIDLDGRLKLVDGRPLFDGTGTLARPPVAARADAAGKAAPASPWTVTAGMKLTPSSLAADKLTVQIGPDDRALKLAGNGSIVLGGQPRLDAVLASRQLDLDRFAGVDPDAPLSPLAVLRKVREAMPSLSGFPLNAHIGVTSQGVMLGSQLLQEVEADIEAVNGAWTIGGLKTSLPGQGSLDLSGRVAGTGGGSEFQGKAVVEARQASALMAWLQGVDRAAAPNAARRLTFDAQVAANSDAIAFSRLHLAIDDATVEGRLAWSRLMAGSDAGRIEADLSAKRLDLDTLPSAAALVPDIGTTFSEADIRIAAQSLGFAGVDAKTASGRIRVGGKLISLEDVTVEDVGGASVVANGRIDTVNAVPQGEIRVSVEGRDLGGLATALRRSPLPPALLDGLADRAAALSPAGFDMVLSFGATRRMTLDGKLGGTVTQVSADLSGDQEHPQIDARLKADSFDAVTLLRQLGLSPLPVTIPGRASFTATLAGPLDSARRWTAGFTGAGIEANGSGRVTGAVDAPLLDGRVTLRTSDVLTPAQLFGVSLPGALPGDGGEVETEIRTGGGQLRFDDLTGAVFDMPMTGALAFTPGKSTKIEGHLNFQSIDAERFASLLSGADLSGAPAKGSVWPDDPFGTGALDGMVGTVALTADAVKLLPHLPPATEARANLTLAPGSVALDGLAARFAGGSLAASLSLSRAALETALTGRVAIAGARLATPFATGAMDLALDLQGTGRTPAALVASLTGGGTAALHQPRFGEMAETALGEVVAAVDNGMPATAEAVRPALESAFAKAPLATAGVSGSMTLAGGVLRLSTTTTRGAASTLALSGLLDMATLALKADVSLTPDALADGSGGAPPAIAIALAGPLDALKRSVDASSLTAWLTVRSAAIEARKLEILEKERIEREKADEAARKAEAERIQKAIDAQKAAEAAAKAEADRIAAEKAAKEAARRAARDAAQGKPPAPTPAPAPAPSPAPAGPPPPAAPPARPQSGASPALPTPVERPAAQPLPSPAQPAQPQGAQPQATPTLPSPVDPILVPEFHAPGGRAVSP